MSLPIFLDTICPSRGHCFGCRADPELRAAWANHYMMPVEGIEICPFGVESDAGRVATEKHPVDPTPRNQWPLAAKLLSKLSSDADTGLGDVAQRLAAKMGGEWFKATFKLLMGYSCGCSDRQSKMNAKYPLK